MHLNSPVGVEKIQKKYVLNVDNISKSYSFKQYPAKNATFKCTQVLIFFFFFKVDENKCDTASNEFSRF